MKTRRRLFRLLGLVFLQASIALVSFEAGLRLLRPHNDFLGGMLYEPTAVTRYDRIDSLEELLATTSLGWKPGSEFAGFVLNSRSLRTTEYARRKPRGVYRLLAFGDSFTYASGGIPHQLHWPTLLERGLQERSDQAIEVLRMGVGATGTAFQLRLWQIEGAHLAADAVVLGFFVGNDFVDSAGESGSPPDRSFSDRLSGVSYLARLIRNGSRAFSEVENVPAGIGRDPTSGSVPPGEEVPGYASRYDESAPTLSRSAHLRIAGQRLDLMHRSRRPRFDALAARVFDTLRGFAQEVEASGARFVVMIIPDEIQIDTELRDEVLHRSGRSEADFDLDLPQRSLAEFFDRHDIEYVDLLPVFRERGARTRLYRTRDTHWNPAGNRLAASQLLERW